LASSLRHGYYNLPESKDRTRPGGIADLTVPRSGHPDGEQKRIPAGSGARGYFNSGKATGFRQMQASLVHEFVRDESLLTGESISVRKAAWDGISEMKRPGGDEQPFVFSGTLGSGASLAQVEAVVVIPKSQDRSGLTECGF